jgi:hypothetical protein
MVWERGILVAVAIRAGFIFFFAISRILRVFRGESLYSELGGTKMNTVPS